MLPIRELFGILIFRLWFKTRIRTDMRQRKIKNVPVNIVHAMRNKALEPYGVTVETLPPSGEINGVPWYQYYTFKTKEEHDEWAKWCKDFLLHKVTPRFKMWEYKLMWDMFDLKYGLKQDYE